MLCVGELTRGDAATAAPAVSSCSSHCARHLPSVGAGAVGLLRWQLLPHLNLYVTVMPKRAPGMAQDPIMA